MQADGSWNGVTVEEVYGDLAGRIRLGYGSGWIHAIGAIANTLMSMGCVLAVLLVPLFAEEYTKGMDALILTGANGKTKCAWAKILAGFLVSMTLVGIVIVPMMSIYLATHGTAGWEATLLNLEASVPYVMSNGQGMLFALLLWVTAGLVLSAVSILISAAAKNSFSGLVISFAVFVVPLLIPWSRFGFLHLPAQFFPALQMRLWNMYEFLPVQVGPLQFKVMWLTIPVALLVTVFCSVCARRIFARHQVMG